MRPRTPHAAAAREALEEAGVVGRVGKKPIGSHSYQKRLKKGGVVVCEVFVFPLEVKRQQKSWPKKGQRQIQWLSLTKAAATVEEGALGEISMQSGMSVQVGLQLASLLAICPLGLRQPSQQMNRIWLGRHVVI